METYGPILVGVVVSVLQSVANKYFHLSEGEKVTGTLIANFVATLLVVGLFWYLGLPVTFDATVVIGGLTIGANQLWHLLIKYSPRLIDHFTNGKPTL